MCERCRRLEQGECGAEEWAWYGCDDDWKRFINLIVMGFAGFAGFALMLGVICVL